MLYTGGSNYNFVFMVLHILSKRLKYFLFSFFVILLLPTLTFAEFSNGSIDAAFESDY